MRIVNLTGRTIELERDGKRTTIAPEGPGASVPMVSGHPLASNGLPCLLRSADLPGEVEGLPAPSSGVIYIVPERVAEVCGRADCFFVPGPRASGAPVHWLVQAPLE